MIRFIDFRCLCLSPRNICTGYVTRAASSADGLITQVRSNCGAGMRWNEALGRCATTSARRHVRRGVVTGN